VDPVQKLFVRIIGTYGYVGCSDSRWFRALLRDLLPATAKQIHALADAAVDGIPAELTQLIHDPNATLRAPQLQARLRADRGWESELAQWTVETWFVAIRSSDANGKKFPLVCPACRKSFEVSGDSIGRLNFCSNSICGAKLRVFDEGRQVAEDAGGEDQPVRFVVSTDGTGHFVSLADAIAKASDNIQIVLQGGPFEGSFEIGKSLSIVGGNPGNKVILRSQKGPCFLIKAGAIKLVNLCIEMPSTLTGAKRSVLEVMHGTLEADTCEFRSRVADAVSVHGPNSAASFHRCAFQSEKGGGAVVWDRAKADFSECLITDTRGIGLSLDTGAHVKFLASRIERSKYLGVKSRNSTIEIDNSLITQSLDAGVEISGGEFVLHDSVITKNGGRGAWIHDKAKGSIGGCDLTNNQKRAKSISPECNVMLQGNRLD
jgi:hypothetical protein